MGELDHRANVSCTLLYASTRNYSQVAGRLGVDRWMVRAKVDEALLKEL